ncbi:hypothetical protein C3B51_02105 [Pseudoalteromonas rubra]|uniref:ParB/Sulfiredoxin domain-containing protein n=1 Tax=Pseudoalteromonas rubra TaxID=43658 RepID=A0A4Q7EN95_9GAMM|nr:hypothetical protein [Pseudoalteromonas rubra]RZM84942.1 hypothetical protein C3B51_02105 [Pseudoalteromonas rubra]
MQTKSIEISSLLLDLDNSRFPDSPDSQRDAIVKMVELQGEKLVNLARDIIAHGMDPSERLIVLKEGESNFVVAEGNRRVTTLKLLNQPDIISENKITKKIKGLLKTNPSIPKEVDCVVYENEEEFEHWINLKHTGENQGIGRVRWTGQESDRHRAKHGETSLGFQFLSFLHVEKEVPPSISGNSKKLKITNINRLLGDPDFRKSLGLEVVSGGILYCNERKQEFIRKVLLVLECMLEVDEKGKTLFTVDRIKKKQDREDFINQLGLAPSEQKLSRLWKVAEPQTFVEPSTKESNNSPSSAEGAKGNDAVVDERGNESSPTEGSKPSSDGSGSGANESGTGNKGQAKSVKPNPNRDNLVPANVKLKISDKKCSGIFKELKSNLRHDVQPNSIAVLIRVFLDLSVSFYIEQNKIQLENNKTGLHDKVVKVTNRLVELKKLSKKQCTAIQAVSSDTLKSKGSLQQYVHNNHMFPDKLSINNTWDNFEPLFLGIWS